MKRESMRGKLELARRLGVDVMFRRAGDDGGDALQKLAHQEVSNCTACRLHQEATQAVFGEGDPGSQLMFVGEAPGKKEDRQGRPFVGRAGKLLDRMIHAMGLRREQVYITNIVKHRPPGNRDPRADEVEACRPYLERQIELIGPTVICTLGRPAANSLLDTSASMGELRGDWKYWGQVPVLPTYHSAYLLRSPGRKKDVWQDLKKIIIALEKGPPAPETLF